MKKIFKSASVIKNIVIVIMLLMMITGIYYVHENGFFGDNTDVTGTTVRQGLKNIGKLETAEYYYTHVEVFDSEKTFPFGLRIPLTTSKFIYSYDGVITAGIDFSDIGIRETENSVIVTMPEADIQNSEIDYESFKLYDEQNSIFNPISITDVNDSILDMENSEKEEAIAQGLLVKANDNAKTLVENFLRSTYSEEQYEIVFETE